jgi:hypothetical protein
LFVLLILLIVLIFIFILRHQICFIVPAFSPSRHLHSPNHTLLGTDFIFSSSSPGASVRTLSYFIFCISDLHFKQGKNRSSQYGGYEEFYLLTYNTVLSVERQPGSAYCLLHAGFLLELLFSLEDEGDMFLRNIG